MCTKNPIRVAVRPHPARRAAAAPQSAASGSKPEQRPKAKGWAKRRRVTREKFIYGPDDNRWNRVSAIAGARALCLREAARKNAVRVAGDRSRSKPNQTKPSIVYRTEQVTTRDREPRRERRRRTHADAARQSPVAASNASHSIDEVLAYFLSALHRSAETTRDAQALPELQCAQMAASARRS